MTGPPDVRDLVGDDVRPDELERLRRADALLRTVPPPPAAVPDSLSDAVRALPRERGPWAPRRLATVLAFAAALSAVFFGVGVWTGREEPGLDERFSVVMQPTAEAPAASALVRVGERDEATGNWELELEVSGLPRLPRGGYYVLWLAKDGRYGATCGTFNVGEGTTSVYMNASYDLKEFDAWVVTAHLPREPRDAPQPWLLRAPIDL